MKYPNGFPQDARARVEAEKLRAYAALEQEVRGIESWRRDVPFVRCIMRVFIAFAHEACEFGKKSNRRAWSDSELDQRCREFLLSIVVDAWEEKAKDLGVGKMFSSPHHWGYSLDDAARRQIEKSPEWKQYQELLRDAYEAQSGCAAACGSQPRFDQIGGTAPRTDDAIETLSSRGGTPTESRENSPTDVPRPFPQADKWEDIEILFLSEHRVQITVDTYSETRNYEEMGFASKKNGVPVLAWAALREMAQRGGVTQIVGDRRKWTEVEKRIQELRKVLRHRFGLTDDPLPFKKKKRRDSEDFGYRAKFKVGCRPSYKS
jgi:hypothetical protein